ncbi:hypothetical protein PG994_012341 [Apiospora phragmitis]|uniref:Uncharacterized protein n=1 Tax=Apiospora phragmitis TaxID=2905665 RepID=A0ABR1TVE1_9PEZI
MYVQRPGLDAAALVKALEVGVHELVQERDEQDVEGDAPARHQLDVREGLAVLGQHQRRRRLHRVAVAVDVVAPRRALRRGPPPPGGIQGCQRAAKVGSLMMCTETWCVLVPWPSRAPAKK